MTSDVKIRLCGRCHGLGFVHAPIRDGHVNLICKSCKGHGTITYKARQSAARDASEA